MAATGKSGGHGGPGENRQMSGGRKPKSGGSGERDSAEEGSEGLGQGKTAPENRGRNYNLQYFQYGKRKRVEWAGCAILGLEDVPKGEYLETR